MNKLLNDINHRPWPIPKGNWKYYQEWNKAVFLHWEVPIETLKTFVAEGLEIDLFNNKAYVSLVAFTMEKIRPKTLPSFPPISDFDEINIRTYVVKDNKPGVHFLSIEAAKPLSCWIAKKLSELPYRHSKMKRSEGFFSSWNKETQNKFRIKFKIEEKVNQKSELDIWLTERYSLHQNSKKGINSYEIHHKEWPLNKIKIEELEVYYPQFNELLKGHPKYFGYSCGVEVIAWDKNQK